MLPHAIAMEGRSYMPEDCRKDLLSLSSTCRLWRLPAQRRLYQLFTMRWPYRINPERHFLDALPEVLRGDHHPEAGETLSPTELTIMKSSSHFNERFTICDVFGDNRFRKLLQSWGFLKKLYIKWLPDEPEEPSTSCICTDLKDTLPNITTLVLDFSAYRNWLVDEACLMNCLSTLSSLKALTLDSVRRVSLRHYTVPAAPQFRLRDISFIRCSCAWVSESRFSEWILSHSEGTLETATFYVAQPPRLFGTMPFLISIILKLKRLSIYLSTGPNFDMHMLFWCRRLPPAVLEVGVAHLAISAEWFSSFEKLPLEHFRLYYSNATVTNAPKVVSMLGTMISAGEKGRLPCIRRLTLDFEPYLPTPRVEVAIRKLSTICSEANVQMVVLLAKIDRSHLFKADHRPWRVFNLFIIPSCLTHTNCLQMWF